MYPRTTCIVLHAYAYNVTAYYRLHWPPAPAPAGATILFGTPGFGAALGVLTLLQEPLARLRMTELLIFDPADGCQPIFMSFVLYCT